MTEERQVFKHARRIADVRGFGIDRTARAADRVTSDWPVLRMENLDTDLPLPPEAIPETVSGLERPASNSWLPFTGDLDLRAAIADFTAERTGHRYDPEREVVVTSGGTSAILDVLLATVDPGDEVLLTDPTYAGIVQPRAARRRRAAARAVPGAGRRVAARPRRVRRGRGRQARDRGADEPVDAVGRRADRRATGTPSARR